MEIGLLNYVRGAARRYAGRAWDRNSERRQQGRDRNWWGSPLLLQYVADRISTAHESGIVGALREALRGEAAGRAVSVGAGAGAKELRLVSAGLVERFDLYELSQVRAEAARRNAAASGFAARVAVHVADVFARAHDPYDLVYWDHSLHHMMDVSGAVAWSVDGLKPGGLLVINDYIGPTRLQWTRAEVRFARGFLVEAEAVLGRPLPPIRYRTPVSRLRMMLRDPSEAPQSDRIIPACRRHCPGFAPTPIGGAMINICGPSIGSACLEDGPAHALLIDRDRKAEAQGMSHFAFGIWKKPP